MSHPETTTFPATAPLVQRAPMRARAWFGFGRGLLFALWPGLRFPAPGGVPAAWSLAARRRRRVLLGMVAALTLLAVYWQAATVPNDGSIMWGVRVALGSLLFAWLGSGFVTALMGAWVMLRGDRHALQLPAPHAPIHRSARTALIMPICNEDVATVFAGLGATCQSLAATGALRLFDIYVLSDTVDPARRAAELQAWQDLRDALGDAPVREGGRVFYRVRRRRTRRKAGNVADFCRRWGKNYRYMIVLDADSIMQGETLVSMVRLMEQHPRAGLVQTLPQGLKPTTLHGRMQQFGNRVTGRLFALGMAYWQLGESHYWGHNAILRVEPFMQHCALAPLPGRGGLSGDILSHDFVEAALMRRAGYEVWLAPQLQGSWEQHPANLLEELTRDRRWCQGNLQNARLIAEPGLRAVHRAMLAVGALSYLMAPVWLGFVALGLFFSGSQILASGLWVLTACLLVLPRLLGVVAVQLRGEQHLFGGHLRLAGSAALELLLSALQAPVRMLAHSVFVIGALTGLRLEWKSPARAAAAVSWSEALRGVGLLAIPALALALLALHGQNLGTLHLAPLLLPLLLAVPFVVWSGAPQHGRVLQRAGLLAVAELGLMPAKRLARRPANATPATPARPASAGAATHGMRYAGGLLAGAAFVALMLMTPRLAFSPQPSPAWHALRQVQTMPSDAADLLANASTTTLARVSRRKARVEVPGPPARMIDEAVRRRAYEAVSIALATS